MVSPPQGTQSFIYVVFETATSDGFSGTLWMPKLCVWHLQQFSLARSGMCHDAMGGVSGVVQTRCYTGVVFVGPFSCFRGYVMLAPMVSPNSVSDTAQATWAM